MQPKRDESAIERFFAEELDENQRGASTQPAQGCNGGPLGADVSRLPFSACAAPNGSATSANRRAVPAGVPMDRRAPMAAAADLNPIVHRSHAPMVPHRQTHQSKSQSRRARVACFRGARVPGSSDSEPRSSNMLWELGGASTPATPLSLYSSL